MNVVAFRSSCCFVDIAMRKYAVAAKSTTCVLSLTITVAKKFLEISILVYPRVC